MTLVEERVTLATLISFLLQVSKFDPQDIYAGERVELLSGQTATVLEVLTQILQI